MDFQDHNEVQSSPRWSISNNHFLIHDHFCIAIFLFLSKTTPKVWNAAGAPLRRRRDNTWTKLSTMTISRLFWLIILETTERNHQERLWQCRWKLSKYKQYAATPGCQSWHRKWNRHPSIISLQSLLWNHFMFGSSYPVGGASEIALRVVPTIERAGGRVLVRAPVIGFSFEGGKVNGVQVQRAGNSKLAQF